MLILSCLYPLSVYFFSAIIYCFNIQVPDRVKELAESHKISVRSHNVIYKLVDDLKKEISSRLPLKDVEDVLGKK